jgi:hypothetical protein
MRAFWSRIHGELYDMMGVKAALDAGVSHHQVAYPRPSGDCSWKCPFFAICPMFDDGSAVESAIEAHYEASDPYDYYKTNDEKKGSE